MSFISDLRLQLDEGSATFFTDNHLYNAANEALIEVWADAKPDLTSSSIVVTVGQDIISLPINDVMIPQYIVGPKGECWVSSQADVERYNFDWRQDQSRSQPKFFIPWGHSKVRLYPKPDTTYTYTLWGVAWPTELSAGNQDLMSTTDIYLKQAIMNRAAAILLESTQPNAADLLYQQSDEQILRYRSNMRGMGGYQFQRLRPAQRSDSSRGGSIKIGRRFI